MMINRCWAMPNKWTFKIKPIAELLKRYVGSGDNWIDPFAGMNSPAEITNDLNPKAKAKFHMRAIDFVKQLNGEYDGILFDPPYSGRQVKECYNDLHIDVQRDDTNAFFYWSVKRAVANKIKIGGLAISFGWNSNGFGKKLGFEIIEVLLVPHGSNHNDTIITIEKKVSTASPITSATPTLAEPKEFNMGLEVPTSSPPKLSPTEITSPNPNIKSNSDGGFPAGFNSVEVGRN